MNLIKIQGYYLGLMVAISLGAVSCTNETEFANSLDKGDITFSAQVGKTMSRTTESAWDGDELIGVKAGETVKTYKVTTNGKMSTEDTPYTWDGTSYDLLAWTPLTAEQINLTDQTTEEKLFDCDLLASNAKVEAKNVHFVFRHQMTRMWWELQKFEGYTDEEVNTAKVSFIGYGSVTYTNGEITTVGDADQLISTHDTKGEYYRNGEAMMVPCEMWEKPLIKVEIGEDTYIYTPSKSNPNDVNKKTGDLLPNTWQRYYLSVSKKGLTVEMESGEINWDNEKIDDNQITDAKFKAIISDEVSNLTNCQFTGLENSFIDNATNGFSITYKETNASGGIDYEGLCDRVRTVDTPNGTVTFTFCNIRSDIKLTYTKEYMEVGYYFYSNGTYGTKYKDGSTLGIIYKIGKHETDNVTNYEGTDIETIHGYVVALTDETSDEKSSFKWKEGNANLYGTDFPEHGIRDGKTTQYLGYLNTKYLIAKAAVAEATTVPAASTSTSKNNNSLIPGTSGWYLPSHTQLRDLATLAGKTFTNYSVLNGTYWDSTFDSDPNAYIVVFNENGAISSTDFYRAVDSEQKVRLILTF